MDAEKLRECRERIDEIDRGIAALLSRRMKVAIEVGAAKKGAPAYCPARESEVVDRVAAACEGVERRLVVRIYREIISSCREVQGPLRPLRPGGLFSHRGFGRLRVGSPVPCQSFIDAGRGGEERQRRWSRRKFAGGRCCQRGCLRLWLALRCHPERCR